MPRVSPTYLRGYYKGDIARSKGHGRAGAEKAQEGELPASHVE